MTDKTAEKPETTDYSQTLFLPQTEFPMRVGLPQREPELLARWAKTDVLILDDWGLAPLGAQDCHDLLEVIEDRHAERSTVIAAQLPVKDWHKYIGDPQVADAALDRVVHAAHQMTLKGESMRKKRSPLAKEVIPAEP